MFWVPEIILNLLPLGVLANLVELCEKQTGIQGMTCSRCLIRQVCKFSFPLGNPGWLNKVGSHSPGKRERRRCREENSIGQSFYSNRTPSKVRVILFTFCVTKSLTIIAHSNHQSSSSNRKYKK